MPPTDPGLSSNSLKPWPRRVVYCMIAVVGFLGGVAYPRPDRPWWTTKHVDRTIVHNIVVTRWRDRIVYRDPKGSIRSYQQGQYIFYEDTENGCLWFINNMGYPQTVRNRTNTCASYDGRGPGT